MNSVCLILSAVGGFADAGSFVLIRSFTGHVTGNTILTAVYLVKSQFALALSSAVAVIAFMAGTAFGTAWKHGSKAVSNALLLPLVAEIVLIATGLAAYNLGGLSGKIMAGSAICFSLGLQNGTLGKLGSVSVHSTYITGMSTSLVDAFLAGNRAQKAVLSRVIACFLAGAAAGAFLVDRLGEAGYAIVLPLLATALALTALEARRSGRLPS